VGAICWSGLGALPQTKTYEIDGVDDTGTTVTATVDSVFDAPANGGSLATSAQQLSLSVPGSEQATSTTTNVNVGQNAQWTVTVFPSNRKTRWLTVFPQSGAGPAQLTVIADSTGLADGQYSEPTLVFQSDDTLPQFIGVPVSFTVGNGAQAKPVIDAVVNGASFKGGAVVPGEIVTLFGTNLTGMNGINLTSGLPLPIDFLNTSVMVDDAPVPLFAVDNVNGQQQINFQIPWEVAGEAQAKIAVTTNGVISDPVSIFVAAQPGIFDYSVGAKVFGAILHANYQLADTNHPVKAGETVLIYCTGLGQVKFPPADGAPADGQSTAVLPSVTIGGKAAHVSFSGLAPGFVGLNQINVEVPGGLAPGNQPVVVTISGAASSSVLLPVR
jgi:adhesin/invasin